MLLTIDLTFSSLAQRDLFLEHHKEWKIQPDASYYTNNPEYIVMHMAWYRPGDLAIDAIVANQSMLLNAALRAVPLIASYAVKRLNTHIISHTALQSIENKLQRKLDNEEIYAYQAVNKQWYCRSCFEWYVLQDDHAKIANFRLLLLEDILYPIEHPDLLCAITDVSIEFDPPPELATSDGTIVCCLCHNTLYPTA